ncbi:hypothetical protein L486_02968 [Kwoniella mangroviensis CBS 10435]|uniref:Uncharacterized protein n=1 Tax=Kwoniella mangroviensis CBS 10435 TaxID=1331196 RepID=A0A1B9IXP1_9TREE|nr:hypothetical protein L486_02968 [Kwoniella mangroviensis CBS 10435]
MSESPSNNANDTQEDTKPDALTLSNGTVLVATKDEEGALAEKGEIPIEEQPKGDLTKITSAEDNRPASALDGVEDEKERHVDEISTSESSTEQSSIPQEPINTDLPSKTESSPPPTPTIAEPLLSENHPSHPSPSVRAATPSSRTSTPPLGSTALAKKKFSSVNVNQKFLSKAGSPAPTAGPTKISSLNGRPSASPVPISSSSSRLLSTKLTTVPTSKSSVSPNPPSSASSSPWAKPVVPLPTEPPAPASTPPTITTTTLHQPAPTRARVLGTTTAPAMGAGLVSAMVPPKPAWKAVSGESRKPGLGISRDFPTAKEVADGKKAAQIAAQAQAAHNQAILQELNTFTQLDPGAHRWDEEDEDDELLDFGDGTGEHPHINPSVHDVPESQPVSKSERFAEDFDRSWPRKPLPSLEGQQGLSSSRRPEVDSNRVLFNASSNRLETSRQPPSSTMQPTRLMSRPTDSGTRQPPPHIAGGRDLDRPLPPHLAGQAGDRALPPHMSHPPSESRPAQSISAAPPSTRSAWNVPRDNERHLPPHLAERGDLPSQSNAFAQSWSPEKSLSDLPARRSFGQAARPSVADIAPPAVDQLLTSPTIPVDAQSAEMHTAAEKAKARRLAEEADREAAAERARRKAKELEERFKSTTSTHEVKTTQTQPPAEILKEIPRITLAQRPRPTHHEKPLPPNLGLPSRPEVGDRHISGMSGRAAESTWRRGPQSSTQAEEASHSAISPPAAHIRSSRPTAESFFEAEMGDVPTVSLSHITGTTPPKKEAVFDDMLARIQAAMAEARATPSTSADAGPSTQDAPQSPEAVRIQSRPVSHNMPSKPVISNVQEYFDVSYPEPPKSPPPAWRTYTIKLPKPQPARIPIPRARLSAAEDPRTPNPHGWLMSFNPPLNGVNGLPLSRAELLLPKPIPNRFQRSAPVVSISPRHLEPFEKKIKKKPSTIEAARTTSDQPTASAESLLPAPTTLKSQSLRDQRTRPDEWRQAESSITVEKPIPPPAEEIPKVEPPPRKIKSPVKTSAAAKAEREGRFAFDGVTIGAPEKERMALSDKPGVRFMVSSELEGDSLLDEVNKMSLETLGEDEKAQNGVGVETAKIPGAEAPKTPPLPRPASPNTSTWPSTSLSYPTSHSPARNSSQHDHNAIKSVWEAQQAATNQSSELNAAAPMYPSLNAPSAADPPAVQHAAGGGMKMAFSNSQTFSSPGAGPSVPSASSYGSLRPSPATHSQYGQFSTPSPDNPNHHMIGMNYQSMTNPRAGTNGFQQGVWSPTAFGTSMASPGYGYTVPKSSMSIDQKSPVAMGYSNAKSPESMVYPGYSTTANVYSQQQQQYGVTPGNYGRGGINQSMYYGYGAPGQQTQGVRPVVAGQQQQGRFAQANGEYGTQSPQAQQQYNLDQGGYYGGLNSHQIQQAMYANNGGAYAHQSHGAVGQNQNGRATMGGTRKMW